MRTTIIGGAYGSGKTEFAIAYAKHLKEKAIDRVGLVDLDIVNPYFRSRDLTIELEQYGIMVISSEPGYEYADIPALSPRIYSLLQDRAYHVVFDVGGDAAGARALGRFNQYFQREPYDFWIMVNPFRPDTRNPVMAAGMIAKLQNAAWLDATGLVANINLGRETTLENWRQGLSLIQAVATRTRLPIIFQAVEAGFLAAHAGFFKNYPVFPLNLTMLPPWQFSE